MLAISHTVNKVVPVVELFMLWFFQYAILHVKGLFMDL